MKHRYDDTIGREVYKTTKWLGFFITARKPKTLVVEVWNTSEQQLGEIRWKGTWRQYTFNLQTSLNEVLSFNDECLRDIADVLTKLNAEHKKAGDV